MVCQAAEPVGIRKAKGDEVQHAAPQDPGSDSEGEITRQLKPRYFLYKKIPLYQLTQLPCQSAIVCSSTTVVVTVSVTVAVIIEVLLA